MQHESAISHKKRLFEDIREYTKAIVEADKRRNITFDSWVVSKTPFVALRKNFSDDGRIPWTLDRSTTRTSYSPKSPTTSTGSLVHNPARHASYPHPRGHSKGTEPPGGSSLWSPGSFRASRSRHHWLLRRLPRLSPGAGDFRTLGITEERLLRLWHLEKKLLQFVHVDSAGLENLVPRFVRLHHSARPPPAADQLRHRHRRPPTPFSSVLTSPKAP